jgi:chromosome segregation ATPase
VEYEAKIRDLGLAIKKLETEITQKNEESQSKEEKDQLIKTLNEKVRVVEEELLQVKKEKDSVVGERDSALSRLSVSEDKVNEEVESRVEVQIELTNLKEKMTDLVRREREAKEKNVEYEAKIRDLGLAIKKLETEIQQTKENITLKYDIIKDKILKQPKKQLEFKEKKQEKNALSKKPLNYSPKIKDTATSKSMEIYSNLNNMKKTHKTPIIKQDIRKSTYTNKFDSKKSKEELVRRLHEKESDLDSKCNYYLGYLAEREKDETIPATCIECPKSIDCMLKKVHKSNKSVKEIKKWYRFR